MIEYEAMTNKLEQLKAHIRDKATEEKDLWRSVDPETGDVTTVYFNRQGDILFRDYERQER
jgi:hypothetical protein